MIISGPVAEMCSIQVNLQAEFLIAEIQLLGRGGEVWSTSRVSRWRGDELQGFHRNRRPRGLRDKRPRRPRKNALGVGGASVKPIWLAGSNCVS